ncbi:MAG: EAL domain-containing protein [Gammaproteobacteria bacterium]|nr:EAL domain-containing protein [Gammaproteobacteria bacterium]
MAVEISHTLTNNVKLLRANASKRAIQGSLIGIGAIVVATALVSYYENGHIGLGGIMSAQFSNPTLWLLDLMPFVFAFWGQYVSAMIAYEAGAMVIDQTQDLRAKTMAIEQQAMHDITHDALTKLPNRVLLHDRLSQALHFAQADRSQSAFLILDLDRFKEINDALGHHSGDKLLNQVAMRLKGTVKDTDTVARTGGDEFGILLSKISSTEDAVEVAKRIAMALRTPFTLEGMNLDVQASVGISIFPDHGSDADSLIQRAEVAMYLAKNYKEDFLVYDADKHSHSSRRLTLMGELRQAIESDQLELAYQPKVDLKSTAITGAEALIRWRHPQHGPLPPDEFVTLAERSGLIKPMTVWVLEHALSQAAAWQEEGMELTVAVNISAQDLGDPNLIDLVAGLLESKNVSPKKLVLEITETSIMLDQERALQMVRRLADMGVRLSIDDFGTGYSSLSYLVDLPISELKIDKRFVMDMTNNTKYVKIVRAIIDLAHHLGLEVISEGTQDRVTYSRLKDLGCDVAQGFYISEPISGSLLGSWMKSLDQRFGSKVGLANSGANGGGSWSVTRH